MKPFSIRDIRSEISAMDREEVVSLCMKLAKFSTANKELLSYLLFYEQLQPSFTNELIQEIDSSFELIRANSNYLAKKSLRKVLRTIKKYSRFDPSKLMEIELRIHFCKKFVEHNFKISNDVALYNILENEIKKIKKLISQLHEDLQYDYLTDLENITS